MSSYPISAMGSLTVKEVDTVLQSATGNISTSEVMSTTGLSVTCADDLSLNSSSGNINITSADPITFQGDVQINGVLGDSATDSLKVGSKTIDLNSRPDPSNTNASGSGLLVCGTDYATFMSTNGASGATNSISVLWTKTGSSEQWVLSGGDLSFCRTLPNGDVCTFTFSVLDSGDLVLARKIGTQVTQSLAYWETV